MARRSEKYREMDKNELEVQQRELAEQIFRLRFQLSTGQAEGLKKMREAKRDLARVKTIVRKVTRTTQHPLYHRVVRSGKKYYAHDEAGEARVGDTVRIVSTRPLSKLKRWRLKEVISRSTRVA